MIDTFTAIDIVVGAGLAIGFALLILVVCFLLGSAVRYLFRLLDE